jgi:hypothetical protein
MIRLKTPTFTFLQTIVATLLLTFTSTSGLQAQFKILGETKPDPFSPNGKFLTLPGLNGLTVYDAETFRVKFLLGTASLLDYDANGSGLYIKDADRVKRLGLEEGSLTTLVEYPELSDVIINTENPKQIHFTTFNNKVIYRTTAGSDAKPVEVVRPDIGTGDFFDSSQFLVHPKTGKIIHFGQIFKQAKSASDHNEFISLRFVEIDLKSGDQRMLAELAEYTNLLGSLRWMESKPGILEAVGGSYAHIDPMTGKFLLDLNPTGVNFRRSETSGFIRARRKVEGSEETFHDIFQTETLKTVHNLKLPDGVKWQQFDPKSRYFPETQSQFLIDGSQLYVADLKNGLLKEITYFEKRELPLSGLTIIGPTPASPKN